MTRDITLGKAKEKLCPFMVKDGQPIHCVGDNCMSWEFTSEQKSIPQVGGGYVVGQSYSEDSGVCKLLCN